jgi:23S rRNA (adenine2503-C2)-methyltransferase
VQVRTNNLLSILPDELVSRIPELTLPEARRLLSIVHRRGDLPTVTPSGVRRAPFLSVRDCFHVDRLLLVQRCPSRLDPFVKYAFRAPDRAIIEAVRIPLERPHRFVACVSSQVGCALGCAFCATGRLGFARSLHAWEIVDQVRLVRDELPEAGRIHGVVFQGMGEPLANVDAVIRSIRVMTDPSMLAIDGRAITVCTAGVRSAIPRLLSALPAVRLGISIGSAIAEKRAALMPIEKRSPLRQVLDLAADHARETRIAPMLAYTLLAGVNDGPDDLEAMKALVAAFVARAQMAPRISLIAYNSIGPADVFAASPPDRSDWFRRALGSTGVPVVRRYSGGADVGAACGQLGMQLRGSEP